jgi:photosystem II stability/assembly factor-like uncharacterized protein
MFCILIISAHLQAQWMQVSGSYGGYTSCLAINGTNLFAGTNNGVFRSTDGGANWTAANSGFTSSVISLVANGSNIFAGTRSEGVFLSTNNGVTWNPINNGMTGMNIGALMIDSTNIIAGTSGGIFLSTNNGANWNCIDSTLYIQSFSTGPRTADTNSFFAMNTFGIYRSTDHGASWVRVLQGGLLVDPTDPTHRRKINMILNSLTVNDSSVFVGSATGVVYRSTDNGLSWSGTTPIPKIGSHSTCCLAAENANIYASDGIGIYRSTDNGTSWSGTDVNTGLPRDTYMIQSIFSLVLHGSKLYAATTAGVFCSTDNGTRWTALNQCLNASAPCALAVNGQNIFASIGGGYFLSRSTNNGESWSILNDTVYYYVRSLAINGSTIAAGTLGPIAQAGLSPALLSTDNGASWSIKNNAPAAFSSQSFGINNIYIFAGTPYGSCGVLRCSVDSTTWNYINLGGLNILGVYSLVVNDSSVFAGTESYGIFSSTDNGDHWNSLNNGLADISTTHFSTLAVNGSNIFAGTSFSPSISAITRKGIYRSTDNGTTWSTINNGLPNNNITALAVYHAKVFAATDSNGIFLSTNNGDSWTPFNTGLPNPYISSLALNDTCIYAGLFGGIWSIPLSEAITSVPPSHQDVPLHFNLGQNYPNPFNPVTTISFTLPSKSIVSLKVFDLIGREVATIVSEEMSVGNHSKQWNASKFSSGIYFYRLQSGSYTETKKLLLLK